MPLKNTLYFALGCVWALFQVCARAEACKRFAMGFRRFAMASRLEGCVAGWFGGQKPGFTPLRLANSAPTAPHGALVGLVNRLPSTGTDPATPFRLPEDGFVQIAPLGEFPHGDGVLQVVDAQAIASLVNSFKPGQAMVVDYDHGSLNTDQSSAAAGWVEELQARADGLYARIRWSNRGRADVEGGAFRFVSPVWMPEVAPTKDNPRVRPARLVNVALTNSPNIRALKPLTNTAAGMLAHSATPLSDATVASGTPRNPMKNLTKHLGLPDDADETMILNRIKEVQAEAASLQNRCKAFEAEAVERDLELHKHVIANRDEVKALLLANRDGTLKLLGALKKPAAATQAPTPLHNRLQAGQPDPARHNGADTISARRNAAVQVIMNREKCDFKTAWNQAKADKPDLFVEEASE